MSITKKVSISWLFIRENKQNIFYEVLRWCYSPRCVCPLAPKKISKKKKFWGMWTSTKKMQTTTVWPGGKRYAYQGGILPGKINFGKHFVRNFGTVFLPGFKPRDRIFPTVFKEISISSCHCLKIKAKNFFGASRRISFLPFQTPRGQNFYPHF